MKITKPVSFLVFSDKLLISGLSFFCMACNAYQPPEKPNVILIMSDDQAWGDFQLHGNSVIESPNLKKIASEGVRFERFYVCPMSAPTRASLLTGRYNLRCGTSWVGRRTEMLGLGEVTMADIFKSAGYATGCFGKWHLGLYPPYHPNQRGFDEFTGFLDGSLNNYFCSQLDDNGKKIVTENEYITDYLTDRALEFIKQNKDRSFFCYIPYNVPHHPFQVPEEYFRKYLDKGIQEDKRVAAVYAMIEQMDGNIGRILDALEELEIEENTIVVFLSDNGPQFKRYNENLKGIKAGVDEGSIRVPLYIRWKKKLPENKPVNGIASVNDVLPTLIELAGIKIPEKIKMDGVSLVPMIRGNQDVINRRMIFSHQTVFGDNRLFPGSVRTERYRLVNYGDRNELYDMIADPYQKNDLALQKPEIVDGLRRAYENWYGEVTSGNRGLPPVPVGFHGKDTVRAVAPDALLKGKLQFNNKHGWSEGWISQWAEKGDSAIWPVEVYLPGEYTFNLLYACDETSVGTVMQLSTGSKSIRATIIRPHTPGTVNLPNVITALSPPLKESWATLRLGEIMLNKGKYDLVLQAVHIPGKTAGEFQALEIIINQ